MRFDEARHLLSRTGFGIKPQELEKLQTFEYADGVDYLLENMQKRDAIEEPAWINEALPKKRFKELSTQEREMVKKMRRGQGLKLKIWWYTQLASSDDQLNEWMTRFWHGHFTSELKKVKWPILMYRQNMLFRKHALGNFGSLLHATAKDGAMILYLDTIRSKKGHPNENFGRELLELFTLGEGNYSESDIQNAARSFTGWSLERNSGNFRFVPRNHDNGLKVFLGQKGNFGGEEIIDIILNQRQTALFVSRKLYRAFVGEWPDKATGRKLADLFYDGNYEIKPLLRAILTSNGFRDPANRGMMIKTPAELIAGTMRSFNFSFKKQKMMVRLGKILGEDLFDPPGVKGFFEGREWITTASLLARTNLMKKAAKRLAHKEQSSEQFGNVHTIRALLLPVASVKSPKHSAAVKTIELCLMDPAYQLK